MSQADDGQSTSKWVGGVVSSHEQLEAADERFWEEAGTSARLAASFGLAVQLYALRSSDGHPARLDRTLFGVRRRALAEAGPDDIVWLGRPPTRIDLLQSLPALDFEKAWPLRLVVEIEGVSIPVVGKADLIRNKRAVGRPQDLKDADALEGRKRQASKKKPRRR